jgi:hypothetical protein
MEATPSIGGACCLPPLRHPHRYDSHATNRRVETFWVRSGRSGKVLDPPPLDRPLVARKLRKLITRQ